MLFSLTTSHGPIIALDPAPPPSLFWMSVLPSAVPSASRDTRPCHSGETLSPRPDLKSGDVQISLRGQTRARGHGHVTPVVCQSYGFHGSFGKRGEIQVDDLWRGQERVIVGWRDRESINIGWEVSSRAVCIIERYEEVLDMGDEE